MKICCGFHDRREYLRNAFVETHSQNEWVIFVRVSSSTDPPLICQNKFLDAAADMGVIDNKFSIVLQVFARTVGQGWEIHGGVFQVKWADVRWHMQLHSPRLFPVELATEVTTRRQIYPEYVPLAYVIQNMTGTRQRLGLRSRREVDNVIQNFSWEISQPQCLELWCGMLFQFS